MRLILAAAAAFTLAGCAQVMDFGERFGVDVVVDDDTRAQAAELCAAGDLLAVLTLGYSPADCAELDALLAPREATE